MRPNLHENVSRFNYMKNVTLVNFFKKILMAIIKKEKIPSWACWPKPDAESFISNLVIYLKEEKNGIEVLLYIKRTTTETPTLTHTEVIEQEMETLKL